MAEFDSEGGFTLVDTVSKINIIGTYELQAGRLKLNATRMQINATPFHKKYTIVGETKWLGRDSFTLNLTSPGPMAGKTGSSFAFNRTEEELPSLTAVPSQSKDAREEDESRSCLQNVKNIQMALNLYSEDNGSYPAGDDWIVALTPYDTSISAYVTCPSLLKTGSTFGYALNEEVLGRKPIELNDPVKTMLVFESTILQNSLISNSGGLLTEPRHKGTVVIGYADGHVESKDPNAKPEAKN